jgi:hypothetical protein
VAKGDSCSFAAESSESVAAAAAVAGDRGGVGLPGAASGSGIDFDSELSLLGLIPEDDQPQQQHQQQQLVHYTGIDASSFSLPDLSDANQNLLVPVGTGLLFSSYPHTAAVAAATTINPPFLSPSYGLAPPLHQPGPEDFGSLAASELAGIDGVAAATAPARPIHLLLTHGCRQLILATIRSYPRMLTRPQTLPPFVHLLGCGLRQGVEGELEDRVSLSSSSSSSGSLFAPLEPLAVGVAVASFFASSGAGRWQGSGGPEEQQLWRAMDLEHRRILESTPGYTQGEALAAIQTMMVFTVIRVIISGANYFTTDGSMLRTMGVSDFFSWLFAAWPIIHLKNAPCIQSMLV